LVATVLLQLATAGPEELFRVTFHTREPLGLKLDSALKVVGFHRASGKGPAEASGWVKVGDVLEAVNELPVAGKGLAEVGRMIGHADLPKVLQFRPPPGQNRSAELAAKQALLSQGLGGMTGRLTISKDGVELYAVPFVQAAFGGRPGCWSAPLVWADPPDACGAIRNPEAVFNAIVVAMRGGCAFSAKASIAEQNAARGLVVVNYEDEAVTMPSDPQWNTGVSLPVVSVSSSSNEGLRSILLSPASFTTTIAQARMGQAEGFLTTHSTAAVGVVAQMTLDGQFCKPAITAPSASASSDAGESDSVLELLMGSQAGEVTVFASKAHALAPEHSLADDQGKLVLEYFKADYVDELPVGPLRVVVAHPVTACADVLENALLAKGAAVIVERGVCGFTAKLRVLEAAGAAMMIGVNTEPGLRPIAAAAASGDNTPPSITVTRGGGRRLKMAVSAQQQAGNHTWIQLRGQPDLYPLWQSVLDTLDQHNWPANARARRKAFYKLSRIHHPDKPGGSSDRFELLNYAYNRANHLFDPEHSTFVDDYAG
jgi:hypothetical protein